MTRDMLIYASSDVLSLVPQVYQAMYKWVFDIWLALSKNSLIFAFVSS